MEGRMNELNYIFFTRQEKTSNNDIIKQKVETIDFIIDNNSLLDLIINKHGGHNDFMGCFSKGWNKLNEYSKNKLLNKLEPETINGRMAIYICPECGDISCGAYCCKIEKINGMYIWKDFAYENNYEEAKIINNVGPFYFDEIIYENIILKLSLI
jgi:hypothetical protein